MRVSGDFGEHGEPRSCDPETGRPQVLDVLHAVLLGS
jgi:hypothetical protein